MDDITPENSSIDGNTIRWPVFLKDVLICSLGAYGGPEAHMSVFLNRMVGKRKYLTESDLIELMALCSILPGPTSTQTMVSIGYRMGGPKLALFTMLVWALPVLIAMTVLSFLYQFLSVRSILLPSGSGVKSSRMYRRRF
jgi:chromate transporter